MKSVLNRYLKSLTLAIVVLQVSSCATLFGKKIQEVTFDSEPRGSRVYVGGKFAGRTPVTMRLTIKPEYEVTYIHSGYIREFTIEPNQATPHLANKIMCIIDFIPGVIFLGLPPLIDITNGSCRGFNGTYFRAMTESIPE